MPSTSRESAAQVEDNEMAEERSAELDGYTVQFISVRQTADLAPMFEGLPDDRCQCPHWGYVLAGRLTWRFGDREEICEAGDAFYVPPGHTPGGDAGSDFVLFSPTHELQETMAAIMRNMEAAQGG
jgi:mannose-6-phosphate isomerase-like protein (cupin superfamily)